MFRVKRHLVDTWAQDGLQCGAVGLDYVCAQVGPKFPVGAFCADVANLFDAEVVAQTDADGLTLIISVTSVPRPTSWLFSIALCLTISSLVGFVFTMLEKRPW